MGNCFVKPDKSLTNQHYEMRLERTSFQAESNKSSFSPSHSSALNNLVCSNSVNQPYLKLESNLTKNHNNLRHPPETIRFSSPTPKNKGFPPLDWSSECIITLEDITPKISAIWVPLSSGVNNLVPDDSWSPNDKHYYRPITLTNEVIDMLKSSGSNPYTNLPIRTTEPLYVTIKNQWQNPIMLSRNDLDEFKDSAKLNKLSESYFFQPNRLVTYMRERLFENSERFSSNNIANIDERLSEFVGLYNTFQNHIAPSYSHDSFSNDLRLALSPLNITDIKTLIQNKIESAKRMQYAGYFSISKSEFDQAKKLYTQYEQALGQIYTNLDFNNDLKIELNRTKVTIINKINSAKKSRADGYFYLAESEFKQAKALYKEHSDFLMQIYPLEAFNSDLNSNPHDIKSNIKSKIDAAKKSQAGGYFYAAESEFKQAKALYEKHSNALTHIYSREAFNSDLNPNPHDIKSNIKSKIDAAKKSQADGYSHLAESEFKQAKALYEKHNNALTHIYPRKEMNSDFNSKL